MERVLPRKFRLEKTFSTASTGRITGPATRLVKNTATLHLVPHRKAKELREESRAIREESALTRAKNIPTLLRNARLKLAAKRLANAMRRRLRSA
jgi:hypothetical protein